MKRSIFILMLLFLAAFILSAEDSLFKFGGTTDGYIIANAGGGKITAGQDINIDIGPVSLDLTADWTETLWDGADTLAFTYALGFTKAFGIFKPAISLTGDQGFALDAVTQSGDWFSDLTPSLNVTFGKVGADLYSDLSFEKNYKLLQTIDASAFFNFKIGSVRAGILYMDDQAATDDVGHPNAPAAQKGVSFYAKAKINY